MKRGLPILIFTSLILIGCEEIPTVEKVTLPVKIELSSFSEKDENCTDSICTKVEVSYPRLSGGDSSITASLNAEIDALYRETLGSRLPEPKSMGSIESLMSSFIDGYDLFVLEFPDSSTPWYLNIKGDESQLINDSLFTLRVDISDYMGGAHGNQTTLLSTFSLSTGNLIDIDAFHDGSLLDIAEKYFRDRYELSAEESLNEAGFIFPDTGFILPENIGVSEDGLVLFYNQYEVAPYSMGFTEIVIPWSELQKDV